jgi:hypothetical protein
MSSVILLNTRLPYLPVAACARPAIGKRSHVSVMNLDLTDEEAALLLKGLNGIIDGDRYFLSDRIRRASLQPRRVSATPRRGQPEGADGADEGQRSAIPCSCSRQPEQARLGGGFLAA